MKIAIKTLGCKVNQAESAAMRGQLSAEGFDVTEDVSSADVCIVNTCTVTARSDAEARRLMRQAARSGAKVIATGCYAQLRPEEVGSIEGVSLVLGNEGKHDIAGHVRDLFTKKGDTTNYSLASPTYPLRPVPSGSRRSRGFLKIQDGCNFACAYCAIPLARGRSRSLPPEEVLRCMGAMIDDGLNEIVLTGIHIGSYGKDLDSGTDLLSILKLATETFPDTRFRLSSIEPHEFRLEYLDLMKSGNLCPHLHIPLQSGSDRILRKMRRGYTVAEYEQLINMIYTHYQDISIGADVIVGFPGESDKDFESTVKLLNSLPLSYLHVFPYSRRPGTAAASMGGDLAPSLVKKRVSILRDISREKKYHYMKSNIGRILDVIIEKWDDNIRAFKALSGNYLKLVIPEQGLKPSRRMMARVKSLTDGILVAESIE